MNDATYLTPLSMFRQGLGTDEIAKKLGCSEATAYNLVHRAKEAERDDRRGKRSDYWNNRYTRDLVPYVGKEERA